MRLPKYGKRRVAQLWSCYLDAAASLILDALEREGEDHGWLFPRHRSVKKWADQAGKLAGSAVESCGWDWTFHWLPHAHATWSLAAAHDGGVRTSAEVGLGVARPQPSEHDPGHVRRSSQG